MILLDESIVESQRLSLQASRIPARQVGVDIGRKGMNDEEVIVLLLSERNGIFITRDADFFSPALRHHRYCLVLMTIRPNEVATFVRRFLRHPDFDTQHKRMGTIVRISHAGLTFWRLRSQTETHISWRPSPRSSKNYIRLIS